MFKSINNGKLPERATKYSAGFDVFANEDMVIGAGETKVIGLGICLDDDFCFCGGLMHGKEYMSNHYLELHPRSSLRAKGLGGGVGIIDMDYREEIKMVIHNPIRHHHLFKKFKPDGDSNRKFFILDNLGFISDDIWENSYSQNEQYLKGMIFKTYEAAKEYKNDCFFIIKRGDKIGQLILKRHEGWLLPSEYTKDEERHGGFGSTS